MYSKNERHALTGAAGLTALAAGLSVLFFRPSVQERLESIINGLDPLKDGLITFGLTLLALAAFMAVELIVACGDIALITFWFRFYRGTKKRPRTR